MPVDHSAKTGFHLSSPPSHKHADAHKLCRRGPILCSAASMVTHFIHLCLPGPPEQVARCICPCRVSSESSPRTFMPEQHRTPHCVACMHDAATSNRPRRCPFEDVYAPVRHGELWVACCNIFQSLHLASAGHRSAHVCSELFSTL
jgi:hypothetical protein